MAPQLPQKFGPYTLHELVGRGGMAEIYRATMPGIGGFEKTVAIKKILPHLTENEEFITMLIDEARIIVSINHFNIAQVYDLGKIDDSYYIAMEYIHGIDLADIIKALAKRGEYVPVPHAVYIGSSICAGLHVAHSKSDENGQPLNIVHRDVSPHNVLLSFAGDVKIIDFGVAKASVKETHTQMGVIKGKLLYMAPEQAMAKPIDGRSDLFAAGLVIYKMLTNTLPFQGENEFQIYNNILTKEITPPRVINPDVPEIIDQIVMKLLARDPDQRYQDGYSAKQDLDRALHQIAPGYTVNRLSRFIDENFAHPQPAAPSSPGAPVPQTPSANHLGTGPQELDVIPLDDDDIDTVDTSSEKVRAHIQANPLPGSPQAQAGQFRATVSDAQTGEFEIPPNNGFNAPVAAPAKKRKVPVAALAAGAMFLVVIALVGLVVLTGDEQEAVDPMAEFSEHIIDDAEDRPAIHQIVIRSEPSAARVYLNDRVEGITPIRLELEHSETPIEVLLEKDGYEDLAFRMTPRSDREHDFELVALAEVAINGEESPDDDEDDDAEEEARIAEAQAAQEEAERRARAEREAEARRQQQQQQQQQQRDTRPAPREEPAQQRAPERSDDIIDPFAM